MLAIESAGGCPGLALARGPELMAERYPEAADGTTEALTGALAGLFDECGVAPSDLAGIGVALGPGSYTGLRVGLALARGLALIDELPVFGIGSLELLALSAGAAPGKLLAAADAGGTRAYALAVDLLSGDGARLGAAQDGALLVEKAELAALAGRHERRLVADRVLAGKLRAGAVIGAPDRRAGRLALEATCGLAAGLGRPAASVLPLYAGSPGARPNSNRVRVSS